MSRAQMCERGFSGGAVDHWARTGRLHRIHRGVYALGHRELTAEGRWMAAVLACGPGALLSHRSAAALWGIGVKEGRERDVTVPRSRTGPTGIAAHRGRRRVDAAEATTLRGIPVTTLPRTLADLAEALSERELSRAIHEAEVVHRLSSRALHEAARRTNGRHGSGRLARTIGDDRDRTRSDLERRFLRLCADHGLPPPLTNTTIAGLEVDFAWPDRGVVAETDGWAYHRTRRAFEEDRRRDQALARAGHRVLRFTHRQVEAEATGVAETLRAALAT